MAIPENRTVEAPNESCCPPGALPMLQQYAYQPRGKWETIGHLPAYISRGPNPTAGVIVFADIFGPNSGRHIQICDQLACDLNLLVVMPDYFDGEPAVKAGGFGNGFFVTCGLICWAIIPGNVSKFAKQYSEGKIQRETMELVVPFMKEEVSRIATVGFCAGAVMTFYLSGIADAFECGVSFHPSLHRMLPKVGVDPLTLCENIKCPQFVVVTKDEPLEWQMKNVVQKTCDVATSGNEWSATKQSHGYFTRGDIENDLETAKAVAIGYCKMKCFLEANLLKKRNGLSAIKNAPLANEFVKNAVQKRK